MSKKIDLRLSSLLIKWYNDNKRELPWRDTTDPYFIWISEIILQQTRVDQGYSYFNRFIKQFPSVAVLAEAQEDEVLKLWQGLGYYSRARNLHAAAKMIMDRYDGQFPHDYKEVLSLKGVGEYTAAAIVSFAYDAPYAVVDGNVYRVLSRIFAIGEAINSTAGRKLFSQLAQELLDDKRAGLHNQAIMEFGALQCVPVSPACNICPASAMCLAYAQGKVKSYPVKEKTQKVRSRYFNYIDIRVGESMFLHKRTGKDIWQNLFELPLIESDGSLSVEDLQQDKRFEKIFCNSCKVHIKYITEVKHVLSHQIIYASFYQVIADEVDLSEDYIKIAVEDVDNYPVSRLVHKYLEKM